MYGIDCAPHNVYNIVQITYIQCVCMVSIAFMRPSSALNSAVTRPCQRGGGEAARAMGEGNEYMTPRSPDPARGRGGMARRRGGVWVYPVSTSAGEFVVGGW